MCAYPSSTPQQNKSQLISRYFSEAIKTFSAWMSVKWEKLKIAEDAFVSPLPSNPLGETW